MDYQATTPVDPRVMEVMLPYFTETFGNPHSRSHAYGWEAEAAIEQARGQVARLIGAGEKELIFTSGATESNNIAIKGVARAYGHTRPHIITAVTEHKCVLESCAWLERQGYRVTYLPVGEDGLIRLEELAEAVSDETLLVSIMAVNNEIGVIQPIEEIGALCRKRGVLFHCDAAQAFGKIPLDVEAMNMDLLSISAHKHYGPKGIGALYIRRRPRVRLEALVSGGGQERGFRSGTLPTPLVAGLGKAAAIASEEMEVEAGRIQALSQRFLGRVQGELEDVYLNGHKQARWPGNINLSFGGIRGESLLMAFKELAVSSASACSSGIDEPSYVLRALGREEQLSDSAIRFGIGRFTTEAEIDMACDVIIESIQRLRQA